MRSGHFAVSGHFPAELQIPCEIASASVPLGLIPPHGLLRWSTRLRAYVTPSELGAPPEPT